MGGRVVDLARLADLDDLARQHHRDLVGDLTDDGEIMGDEQVRQSEPVLQRLQERDDLRLRSDVERRDRFVAHDEVGIHRKRPRDDDALALSAGELRSDIGA